MNCPTCDAKSHVTSVRTDAKGTCRRTRQCSKCFSIWTTVEVMADSFEPIIGNRRDFLLQLHTLQGKLGEVMAKLGGMEKADSLKLTKKIGRGSRGAPGQTSREGQEGPL